jgi:ABC-type nitrate/sulfonate/bicarbonate transport system substrate-binding protein
VDKIKATTKCVAVVLVLMLLVTMFTACTPRTTYQLYVPDGAPLLSVAKLLETDTVAVNITSGEGVVAEVAAARADFALLPTNAFCRLYSNGAPYVMLSANVFGVLYIVGNAAKTGGDFTLDTLKGEVLHTIGRANTPEYVLKKVLTEKNIPFVEGDNAVDGAVTLKFYSSASDILPLLASRRIDFALIGEPAVSKTVKLCSEKGILLEEIDLQQQWKAATNSSESYPQACFIAKKEVVDANSRFVAELLAKLAANEQFLRDNAAKIGDILTTAGSSDLSNQTFTAETLARCNIRFRPASDVAEQITAYLATFGMAFADNNYFYIQN